MVAFLIYLLKSSFCLTLLYGFYKLFFASTTRFSLNRWVLVGGMLTCLLLPFVSLELEHELSGVHEYQADEGVLDQGIDVKIYQLLLVRKAVGSRLYSMACGFTHSSLKKRISMMSKKKKHQVGPAACLVGRTSGCRGSVCLCEAGSERNGSRL